MRFLTLAFLIIMFVIPTIVGAQDGIVPCGGVDCDFGSLVKLGDNIVDFLVVVSASVMAVIFAWAGITYMTAGGDEGKIKKAHDMLRISITGFIIVLASWLIVYTITTTLLDKESQDIILLDK